MQKAIFITGAHRSGSTWAGKMISAHPKVRYIHEPFNVAHGYTPLETGVEPLALPYWFTYLPRNTRYARIHGKMTRLLTFDYNPVDALPQWTAVRARAKATALATMIKYGLRAKRDRLQRRRPLVKDPIAFFAAEWMDARFQPAVVILVRSPLAFAASLKVKGWEFDFNNLLNQPQLMTDYLSEFRADIAAQARHRPGIIDQAILLWRIIYRVAATYRRRYPHWIFITYETLAADPEGAFETLFKQIGLDFPPSVRSFVRRYNAADLETDSGEAARRIASRKNLVTWQDRLTGAEIEKIVTDTQDVFSAFYTERELLHPID